MEVFENANKFLAIIARHCMVARGEFLWRLAIVAETRYFFRFSYADVVGSSAAPFGPSVAPLALKVDFSKVGGFYKLNGPSAARFRAPLDAAVIAAFGGRRTCYFSRSVSFQRSERGVFINTAPLRDGDFVLTRPSGAAPSLVRLQALVEVAGAPHEEGLFLGFLYVPRDAAQREFEWSGDFVAGNLRDVFGRALTFDHPKEAAVVCFSAVMCEYFYM